MSKPGTSFSVTLLNGVGAALVAVLALTTAWLIAGRADQLSRQETELDLQLSAAHNDLIILRKASDRQLQLINEREKELSEKGKLPSRAPLEEYLQTLARLATERNLKVRSQRPAGQKSYPGLTEQRYTYEVTGSAPDIISLLAAIEAAEYWCDVSYLAIEDQASKEADASPHTAASMTISLFSEPEALDPGKQG